MKTDPSSQVAKGRINLKWDNLRYIVPDKFSDNEFAEKIILNRVRGSVCSGKIIGILGPSGSGKTSLLNCLSQRVRTGVHGDILLNGKPVPRNFSKNMGYVSQDDIFFPSITVHETLYYSAQLKLNKRKSAVRHSVMRVLDELDLGEVKNSLVGEIGKGISGGERRRLAIANQIIDEPVVLLLDEPTSGLDAASAMMVVKLLKRMTTDRRVAVICTIHQPRVSVLKLFDSISLMGMGKVLYFGETIPTCLDFFSQAGYECPAFENPADWMLDLVNTSESVELEIEAGEHKEVVNAMDESDFTNQVKRQEVVNKLAQQFENSKYFTSCMGPHVHEDVYLNTMGSGYRTSICNQVYVLTKRNFMYKLREPVAVGTQLFNDTAMPLIIGAIYFNLGLVQTSISDRMSFISLAVLMQAFSCFDCILLFPLERKIYLREQKSGLYRTSSYVMSKNFSEHPVHALVTCIGAPIYYFMAGLQNDAEKFLIFLLLMTIATILGASVMSALGAIGKTMEQSNLIATIVLILFMLFDGTWVSLERIPKSLSWISKLSFMGLAVQAAIKNEFMGLELKCDPGDSVCFHTGEEALIYYGFDNTNIWKNMLTMLLQILVWKIIAYLAVRFMHTGSSIKERLNQ